MRRVPLLVVFAGIVLAVGACGATKRAATPQALGAAAKAAHDPELMLQRFRPPPGSMRLAAEPHAGKGLLGNTIGALGVDEHRFWRVPLPYRAALAFAKAHPPRGSHLTSSLLVGRVSFTGPNHELTWAFPPLGRQISLRTLSVTLVRAGSRSTAIRVDAHDIWKVKPPNERVPAGVREITIRRDTRNLGDVKYRPLFLRVTDPSRVRAIARSFDRLQLFRGDTGDCPAIVVGPALVFDFRGDGGRILLQARVYSGGVPSACGGWITVDIGGRAEPPLAGALVPRTEKLLGRRLVFR